MGIRVARAHTGRKGLLRLEGNYHGWADELGPPKAGGAVAEHALTVPPNDLGAVERELATRRHALLLVEGGGSRIAGRVPMSAEYFRALPDLARKYGTLVQLDEVVTGFREAEGGWQAVVGMRPDLTTVGKAVSGGLPSGALLGRADVLAVLDPASGPDKAVMHGGTWNAVPITCAAGIAALDVYRDSVPQRAARAMADKFRPLANAELERIGARARVYGRSVVHLYLGEFEYDPADDTAPPTESAARLLDPALTGAYKRLDLHLLQRGVASMRGEGLIFSAAHTEADVEQTVRALVDSVAAMIEEGSASRR
jgi:glutamate-1-semialdehyde 2,1-aminomutase